MKTKPIALAVLALLLGAGPAQAFLENSYQPGGVYTGGTSSSKSARNPGYPAPQEAQPVITQIRMSGSGNNAARQAVIENDPNLHSRVSAGQARARDILIGRVDLNGDGENEVFAFNKAAGFCAGEYCPFSVYQVVRGQPLRRLLVGYMTVGDVGVLEPYRGRGWRDIVVYNQRGRQVVLGYDGTQYTDLRRRSNRWPSR